MMCKHCNLEIKQITDPWGHTSHTNAAGKRFEYEWYHVAATDNDSDGRYITACPDDSGEEAEPLVLCEKCEKRPATHEGQEVIAEEMGHKQYGTINLCDHCDPPESEPLHDTREEQRGER